MGGGDDSEKKPSLRDPGRSRLRSLLLCSFAVTAAVCLIYSSRLLLLSTHPPHCPSALSLPNSTSIHAQIQDPAAEQPAEHQPPQQPEPEKEPPRERETERDRKEEEEETDLKHIVFCIAASSGLWNERKEYIKQWWRPRVTRGVVWVDKPVRTYRNEGLPEIRISGGTSRLPYKHPTGLRSALRISRIVSETLRLGQGGVRWFVMGDDDTVFVAENVVRVLRKYDHREKYYIGSSSESHLQNLFFSYKMAYGGGGFAISYPLAVALEKMQDRCIKRYAHLYGSDDRIQACMAELGVPLTPEPGFHQYDVYGDLLGLLAAHPVAPLVSLHHLDVVEPIFPGMSRAKAVERLLYSAKLDSASLIQQSICYDKRRWWSISVSWGFAVQISRGLVSPRELEIPARTFLNWYKKANYFAYSFNTRPVFRNPCQKPFTYYLSTLRFDTAKNETVSVHSRHRVKNPACRWKIPSPETINTIVVHKTPDPLRWQKSPRRDCCRVLPSSRGSTMHISVGNCRDGEFSEL